MLPLDVGGTDVHGGVPHVHQGLSLPPEASVHLPWCQEQQAEDVL